MSNQLVLDVLPRVIRGRKRGSKNARMYLAPKVKVGKWRIVRRVENYKNVYERFLCRCACDTEKLVLGMHLRSGKSRSCGCGRVSGKAHYKWTGHGEISGAYWDQIRHGATDRKGRSYSVEFLITIEYVWKLFLKQKRRCALTGLLLTMSRARKSHTASLDRIRSDRGYVAGNVQWVHKEVNMMKRTMSQTRFVEMCGLVAAHKCRKTEPGVGIPRPV